MPPAATPSTAALMGARGRLFCHGAIFIAAAALCIPALIALGFIRPDEIDYARARNAAAGAKAHQVGRVADLLTKTAGSCCSLPLWCFFSLPTLRCCPLIGENLATTIHHPVVALDVGPDHRAADRGRDIRAVGRLHSEKRGRRPLLAASALRLEPVRAALLAFTPCLSVPGRRTDLVSGITGASHRRLTVIVITDLTAGTGRFNLAQGARRRDQSASPLRSAP